MLSMIPTWMISLAAEAVELEEGAKEGRLLDSNVFNIVIILGVVIYLGRNVVGEILAKRKQAIIADLEQAEQAKQAGLEKLADAQQQLAQAQQEAERIRQQAEANAEKLRADLIAQAEAEIERLRAAAEKDVGSERDRVIQELRRQLVAQALAQAEGDLPQRLDPNVQHRLVDRNIALIGGR